VTAAEGTGASGSRHRPVLVDAVVRELIVGPGDYLDATVGDGGHAEAMLTVLRGQGRVIGLDRDAAAIAGVQTRLAQFGDRLIAVHADYRNLADVIETLGVRQLTGALFDLGLSTPQIDDPRRGFAYRFEGSLDLRFDQTHGVTASEWINRAGERELTGTLREYGEERHARRLARGIIATRRRARVETTGQLNDVIRSVVGAHGAAFGRTAARVYQALRIKVNDELAAIPRGINAALEYLRPGGRAAVIAYHSLEDRLVKQIFRSDVRGRPLHRRVIRPDQDEIAANPRAKAARLRVFERTGEAAFDEGTR